MKVLVLGVTGMLGSMVFKVLSKSTDLTVWGTLRGPGGKKYFDDDKNEMLLHGVDVTEIDSLLRVVSAVKPDVVINCIGLIKQLANVNDPLVALPINAMLPHRLAQVCEIAGARLVHVSTDCVFSGDQGRYRENSVADARDLYGLSKYIGEVSNHANSITLRTSIIGHELDSSNALVDWFLSQEGEVKGYAKAIFSGLPTVELAEVVRDYVLPNPNLSGLYHLSAEPISKLDLLGLVADVYGKKVLIVADEQVCIDRSLDSSRFRRETGYKPPPWPELIAKMHQNRKQYV